MGRVVPPAKSVSLRSLIIVIMVLEVFLLQFQVNYWWLSQTSHSWMASLLNFAAASDLCSVRWVKAIGATLETGVAGHDHLRRRIRVPVTLSSERLEQSLDGEAAAGGCSVTGDVYISQSPGTGRVTGGVCWPRQAPPLLCLRVVPEPRTSLMNPEPAKSSGRHRSLMKSGCSQLRFNN